MADPLSVIANIIAVLKLATAVKDFLVDIRNASREASEILLELSITSGILSTLKDTVERTNEDPEWRSITDILAVPNGPLAHFQAILEHLSSKLEPLTGLRRTGRALRWPFKKQQILDILRVIERQKALFILALQNESLSLSNQIKSEVADVKKVVQNLEQHSLDEKALKILDWLSPLDPRKKHLDIRNRRLQDSGQWFLERDEYRQWCCDGKGPNILFCPGNPGTGKTYITSLVIDEIAGTDSRAQTTLAYFYYDYNNEDAQTNTHVVGSLLKQVASQRHSLPRSIISLYDELGMRQKQPQLEDLVSALTEVCQTLQPVTIVIDALDECNSANSQREILQVMKRLSKVCARLFITSRPHIHGLTQSLENCSQITIEASASDISRYVIEAIKQDEGIADLIDKDLKDEIVRGICKGSHGMFLLPALQIQYILNQTTRAEVKQALREAPVELNAALEKTLARIGQQSPSKSRLAMRVLMWLTYLKGPLSTKGLRYALAVRIGESQLDPDHLPLAKHMIESCFGLVTVDEENSSFRLMHFSLKEYFLQNQDNIFPTAQQDITNTCLSYLSSDGILEMINHIWHRSTLLFETDVPIERSPHPDLRSFLKSPEEGSLNFLTYATLHWAFHAQDIPLSTYEASALKLLTRHSRRTCFVKLYNHMGYTHRHHRPLDDQASGLGIASFFNMMALMQLLLSQGHAAVDERGSSGRTALYVAVGNGRIDIARFLLTAGADPDILALMVIGPTLESKGPKVAALHVAVKNNEIAMAKLLLDHGANVNIASSSGRTPLIDAVKGGYFDMIRLLASHGADVQLKDKNGLTALDQVTQWQREIIQQIFDEREGAVNDPKTSCSQNVEYYRKCTVTFQNIKNLEPSRG